MEFKYITLAINDSIATLTLDRPDIHNAFDDVMIAELISALQTVDCNKDVRLMILRGNGKSFSACADVNWMQKVVNYNYEENLRDAQQLATLMHLLYHLHKPTIAVVHGVAFGGGIGLVSCCDLVIASEKASFCFSETRLGIIPAVISPYIINAIGERAARRYFLTAERFTAEEAYRLGLAHVFCSHDELEKNVDHFIAQLLQNGPTAVAAAKQLIVATSRGRLDKAMIDDTAHRIAVMRTSAEGQEGLRAFLEKRAPTWQKMKVAK
ncbi:MAG: enoyl-CoA hydratase/isomerase family protein [Gammaproteobacteria bacterium]